MNTIVEHINSAGFSFVEFAVPMLVQSGILIVILLLADLLLRKKVKAVFRYWIWMLVLLKLVLPTSLSSPLSLGYLFGEKLTYQELAETASVPEPVKSTAAETLPGIDPLYIQPNIYIPPTEKVTSIVEPLVAETVAPPPTPVTPLSWQGVVFLVWLAVVMAMGLLLLQRALFVRGLVAQAKDAPRLMNDALEYCRESMKIKGRIGLKISPNATTPSVCGLIRPVILVPWNLASTLGASRLRTVLMHELAHIRRADLWVNLAQTVLQIIYFYNPLFWIANCIIRRIREQAVDEAVLVAMGGKAQQYPQTLVDVAKMAFKRPALSLRLIGVVESESALSGRIKHILGRPLPKSARLGLISILAIIIAGAILLPMAMAQRLELVGRSGPLNIRLAGVRPDGGGDIYDDNGNKIAENTFANIAKEWGEDKQHRTFIFELPVTEEPILFFPFLKIKPAGAKRGFGTGQHPLLYYSGDKLTYSVGVSFPRTYKKVFERRVKRVDLTLRYYYGQRGAADFVFTGPFVPGQTVKAEGGADCELTPKEDRLNFGNHPAAFFRISSETRFDEDSILVYDTSGRRYLLGTAGGRSGRGGTYYSYRAEGLTLNSIAYVTVGEKPYEATFTDVVVSYPGRPVPERLEFLDEMCERLDLTGLSGDQLNNYTFGNSADAIKVIDIVRGRWFVMQVFNAIMYSKPRIELSNLDPWAQQKIRSAAAGWAKAGHPDVRAMGIRLGLVGGWPEFMDLALDWLEQDATIYNMASPAYGQIEEKAKGKIASEIASYPDTLRSEHADRLKEVILRTESPRLGMRLFPVFWRAENDLIFRTCRDLVQDDRPWIWWPAMRLLSNRCTEKLRPFENLPEKMQKRLILVKEASGSSSLFDLSSSGKDYKTVSEEAYAMLPAIFTARLARMNSSTCHDVRQVMAKYLDREIAAKAMIDFLREISTESNQRLWVGDSPYFSTCCSTAYYIARRINSLYDVDINNLGKYEAPENSEAIPHHISQLKQLIVKTLQWYDGRSGAGNESVIAAKVGMADKVEEQVVSLDHFVGRYALAGHPDTAAFEITKKGDVFIFSGLDVPKFEMDLFLRGLEGRKFEMEKGRDSLRFGKNPRERYRVRYNAAEGSYILDRLGMRGVVQDATSFQLSRLIKISPEKPEDKTDVQVKIGEAEPVLVEEIETAGAGISLPIRKIFSGKTDKGGSFEWETSIDPRVRFRHGWYTVEDGAVREHVGGGSQILEESELNLKLDVEVDDNTLNLKVQRVHDSADGSRTEAVASKTPVPAGAHLKHVSSIDSAVLTNNHLTLWQGDFIRDGKVLKSVIYAAYLTTPDDPETGFKPPVLQEAEFVTAKVGPDGRLGIEEATLPKLVMLLDAINSCAAEIDLNIDTVSITAKNISMKGDTSGRANSRKFLDAIKDNGLSVSSMRLNAADNRDKFSIIVEPKKDWQQWWQQRKTDVQFGAEETVSPKLIMLLVAIKSIAAEMDLNIESISVSAKSMSIEGDTSGRTDTLKFLDAIKDNGLDVSRLNLDERNNRDRFSITVEPKKDWQQWWQQHKTDVPVGIKSDDTVQAVPLKAFEFELVGKLLDLVKQVEKEYPRQATHWPAGAGLYHIDAQGRITVWHYRSLWQRSKDCAPDEVGWGSSQLVNAVGMYYLPDGTPLQSRWRERGGGMKDIRIQVGREVGQSEHVPVIHRHRLPKSHDLLSRDGLERKILLDSWKDLPLAIIVRVDRPMRLAGWWLGDVKTDIQHFNEYDQLIVTGPPGNNNKPMLVTVGLPETAVKVEGEKGWGEVVEGVQCRLRSDKMVWKKGEIPTFKADVRNRGQRKLELSESQRDNRQVEVDGRWYLWDPRSRGSRVITLEPGQVVSDLFTSLSGSWQRAEPGELDAEAYSPSRGWLLRDDRTALELTTGEHIVRVAFIAHPTRANTGGSIRLISNPVEIEILPKQKPDVPVEVEVAWSEATGRAVDVNGQGISGAILEFWKWDTEKKKSLKLGAAQADETGHFKIPEIEAGKSLSVWISADGFAKREAVSICRRKDETYLPDDLNFQLKRLGIIEGQVIGPDGKPLAHAPLSLSTTVRYQNSGEMTSNHLRAITDEKGRFGMEDVPPGMHLLYYPWSGPTRGEVKSGKWRGFHGPDERWPSAPVKGVCGAMEIKLGDGQKLSGVVMDLSKSTCNLRGQVRDTTGRLVKGARVSLYWKGPVGTDTVNGEGYPPAVTDAEGRYHLENLPPGKWHVKSWHDQFKHTKPIAIELVPGKTIDQDLLLSGQLGKLDIPTMLKTTVPVEVEITPSILPKLGEFPPIVFERIVGDRGANKPMFVDVDTGRIWSPSFSLTPADAQKPVFLPNLAFTKQLYDWVRRHGIDVAVQTDGKVIALMGMDMRVGRQLNTVESKSKSLMPSDVINKVELTGADKSSGVVTFADLIDSKYLEASYPVITREGGVAVLEVAGLTDLRGPNGIRIRYQIVRHPQLSLSSGAGSNVSKEITMVGGILGPFEGFLCIDTDKNSLRLRSPDGQQLVVMKDGSLDVWSNGELIGEAARLNTGIIDFDAERGEVTVFGRGCEAVVKLDDGLIRAQWTDGKRREIKEGKSLNILLPEIEIMAYSDDKVNEKTGVGLEVKEALEKSRLGWGEAVQTDLPVEVDDANLGFKALHITSPNDNLRIESSDAQSVIVLENGKVSMVSSNKSDRFQSTRLQLKLDPVSIDLNGQRNRVHISGLGCSAEITPQNGLIEVKWTDGNKTSIQKGASLKILLSDFQIAVYDKAGREQSLLKPRQVKGLVSDEVVRTDVTVGTEEAVVGGWEDVGNPIPADFNDTIALTEKIKLGSIGRDVEGKSFITFIWNKEKDRNRQYRFVLINKNDAILEPDSHLILDENGRLEEKFTFDEPYLSWRLIEFKFQSRPMPLVGIRSISSQLQKDTSTAFEGKTISPSRLAPPGRYAIEFDGDDDYLFVPDSPTLRLEPPFTVEMWIKPKLPEQKPDRVQQWGVIAKGGYVGTGRVKTRGFGIEFTRFEKEPATFNISYTEANDEGLFGQDYGRYPFDEWTHISHVFEGKNYEPGHGHPLVVGRFLIPMPEPFMGQIGEIRIWNGARKREEIRRYRDIALTGREPGLAACWTFEQGEGQFAYDMSGNNNHARFGKAIEADDADPKWVDLEAAAHQPRVKSDVHLEVAQSGGDSEYGSGNIAVISAGKSTMYGSIQEAIDAAPAGSVVRIGPGVYEERLEIDKPLTLEGAGWEQTAIVIENNIADMFEEALSTAQKKIFEAKSEEQRQKLAAEFRAQFEAEMKGKMAAQTHLVSDTEDVVIRNLKLTSPGRRLEGKTLSVPVIKFSNAGALMSGCAIVGTPGDGIHVVEGSDVQIRDSLVAGVWSTGIAVAQGRGNIAKARIINCDVRNCHHRGITIGPGCDSTVVEGCRISGSSWHGIRYDSASPRIVGNLIFANVRYGIYASGETAADVRQNLFYGNEMSGISCWFKNQDTIEENTFVGNKRSGLEVLGASRPVVRKNIFYSNPTGVFCGNIGNDLPSATSDGTVNLEENLFWGFEYKVASSHPSETGDEIVTEEIELDEKTRNVVFDPECRDIKTEDFSLKLDSTARKLGIGAADLIDSESPWPIQDEEIPVIPEEDTEDTSWMGQISSTGKIARPVVPVEVEGTGGKNTLAWGGEVDGLQLGLNYDSSERPYYQGEIVSFDVHIRNNGNEAVDLSYVELFHWCPHARDVTDANDAISIVNVNFIRGDASAQEEHTSLGPGDRQSLGKVTLQIGPLPKGAQRTKYSADLEPGRYIVTQTGKFGGIGYDSWRGKLTTGELPLIVLPAQTSIGQAETRGGISGVVVNSVTGQPIAGAYVGVGDFGDSGGSNYSRHRSEGFHDKTKTDAEGRFELNGLVFTDKHRELEYHPLVVTHPDFVRHDEKIELLSSGPVPDVKVSLRPAAKIEVTIVDAEGNPVQGRWLLRLEALDGRRFIPPGSDPHLSSFASNVWAHWPDMRTNMGFSNGFTFTELDSGRYLIEAIRVRLVDKPAPGNIWKPTITYHGSIPSIEIEAGQSKQVRLTPQDNQTKLTITPPEFPDKLMDKLERSSQMPLMCLISRSPGAMLWDDGRIRHLEDQRFGRIDKERFFRGFFTQGQPLTINNLPPCSYSLFTMAVYGQVAGYLIGARVDLAKGDKITVDIPWRQPTGPSMFGPNRSFDYPVNLEARDYSISELCGILTEITQSNPRIVADSTIENEKLKFGSGQMSVWDVLEKLHLDNGWKVEEAPEKTLILRPDAGSTAKERRFYLPDLETPRANVILDLATGEMLQAIWLKDNKVAKLGKGDVVYEYSSNRSSLLCLRGATMQLRTNEGLSPLEPDIRREYFAGYLLKEVPCQYQVTTAEGDKYELKVISIDRGDTGGAFIQFWKSEKQKPDVPVEEEDAYDKAQIENIIDQLWTAIEAKDAKTVKKLGPSKEFIRKDFDINKWILKQTARRDQLIEKENHDISKMESVVIEGDRAVAVTGAQGEGIVYLFNKVGDQWTLYEMLFGSRSPVGPAVLIDGWRQTELKQEAWAEYLKAGELLHKGTDRSEMAKRFSSIGRRYSVTRRGRICSELGRLLAEMAAEDRDFIEPENLQSLPTDKKINHYIFKLRDVAEQEMFVPGKCRVLYYPKTPNSAAVALRGMGKTVIPAMIGLLDDRRPTRSVGLQMNNAVILRYCDAALEIIEAIAAQKFDKRTERGAFLSTADHETSEEIISYVKVWWEKEKQKPDVPVEGEGTAKPKIERPRETSTRRAIAERSKERIVFLGLDLTDAPRATKSADLSNLFEERPPGSKSYHIRDDVTAVYNGLYGTVYYIPDKEVFYIQHDKLGSSTLTFYGPFKGDPHQVLDMEKDVPIKAEEAEASSGESEVTASEDGPRITFESLVCDLGQVPPKTKHVCEFKFTNTGNEVLKITKVRSTCGCIISKLTKKEFTPGESETLQATYQSSARTEKVKKYVFVYSNDEANPEVILTVKAEIVIKVAHEPKRFNLVLDKENAGCPAIKLTSIDNQPFSITGFKSTGDSITVDFDPSVKETSFVLKPKVDMEKLRKGLRGQINVSLTHPECKKVTIYFDTLAEFKADPRVVYVREAEPLKPVTKTVRVFSNYNEDVEIESTSSNKGTVKVLAQEKVHNGYQFELEITPPLQESNKRVFTDVFTVVLKGGRQLQITCYGIYSKKPAKTVVESAPKTDTHSDVEKAGEKFSQLMGADLPDSVQNIRFLSGSFEAASKTWTRFDIPLSDLKKLLAESDMLPDFSDLHKNLRIQKVMDAVSGDFNVEWWKSDELENPVCAAWIKSNRIKGNPEVWMVHILNICCSQLNNNLIRVYISLYSDSPYVIPKINPDMEREIEDPQLWSQELAGDVFDALRANDNSKLKALIADEGRFSELQEYRRDYDFSGLKKMVNYQKADRCYVIVSPIIHKELKDSNREIQISFQLEQDTWKAQSIETTGIGVMEDLLKEEGFNVFSELEITREFLDTTTPNSAHNSTLQVELLAEKQAEVSLV